MRPDTLIIVPTYNERDNIVMILNRIRAAVPEADVLVVDDGSPDGTAELVSARSVVDAQIMLLSRSGKQGLGRAYLAGFEAAAKAGYQRVVEIDADGSHDPAELPAMLALSETHEVVLGSRWVPGGAVVNWPRHRQAISRMGNGYARRALRSNVKDMTAGFRVFRTDALALLDLPSVASQGYCFQVELAWRAERAGLSIAEHPITFVERENGVSKMHAGIVAEALSRVTVWGIRDRLAGRRKGRAATLAD